MARYNVHGNYGRDHLYSGYLNLKHLTAMLFRFKLIITGVILVAMLSFVGFLQAQNEIATQRTSLQGLQQFYMTINLEAGPQLSQKEELDVSSLQKKATEKLKEAGLPLETGKTPRNQDHAMLIMHINTMYAGQGIVPFAVNIDLYQPVKLTLNRDLEHTASTWNTGNVGVVSFDNLPTIPKSALTQLDDFIKDFKEANRSKE